MLSRKITIADEFGLHARPAARIASNAERARSNVWIIAGSERADAKSMLSILMLGCPKGSVITVGIDDPRDIGILDRIASTVGSDFPVIPKKADNFGMSELIH